MISLDLDYIYQLSASTMMMFFFLYKQKNWSFQELWGKYVRKQSWRAVIELMRESHTCESNSLLAVEGVDDFAISSESKMIRIQNYCPFLLLLLYIYFILKHHIIKVLFDMLYYNATLCCSKLRISPCCVLSRSNLYIYIHLLLALYVIRFNLMYNIIKYNTIPFTSKHSI